jgi:hypothetical protein
MTMNLRGHDALGIERAIDRIQRTQPWIDTTRIHTPEQIELAVDRIEFFNFDPPAELIDHTDNNWFAVPGGYRLSLPKGEWMSVASNLLDNWDIEHGAPRAQSTMIRRARTLPLAIEAADRFVAVTFAEASQLVQRQAHWRDQPPTDKQKEVLARYKVHVPGELTRGQAAHMISMVVSSHRSVR